MEWLKSTGLRPFLDALEGDERAQFLEDYAARLGDRYLPRVDGKVLLAFPRLFLLAVKT